MMQECLRVGLYNSKTTLNCESTWFIFLDVKVCLFGTMLTRIIIVGDRSENSW